MQEQLRILLELYYKPHAAMCRVLDEGRFLFALIAAVLASVLFFGLFFNSLFADQYSAVNGSLRAAHIAGDEDDDTVQPAAGLAPRAYRPVVGFLGGSAVFGSLVMLAGLYVPAAVIVIALWDSLGGGATILRRDYLPVLTCHLFSYAAILLPLGAVQFGPRLPLAAHLGLVGSGALYFLFLSGTSLRVVMGTNAMKAAVTIGVACGAAAFGVAVYTFMGSAAYYLTSPFFLYYAYSFFQGDIRIIGSGLSSRQSLRRQLEAAKLNPRDSDAHYQVGLIQAQRRQWGEAEASFKKAIEIAPDEPDAYFQLARIVRGQGRLEGAMAALRTAAALDDKHSSSEVLERPGRGGPARESSPGGSARSGEVRRAQAVRSGGFGMVRARAEEARGGGGSEGRAGEVDRGGEHRSFASTAEASEVGV